MMYVRSTVPYQEFITGRGVDSAVHYEDGRPGCVGIVEVLKPDDVVISQGEYLALVGDIQQYNRALPPPVQPPVAPSLDTILRQDLEAATTLAQLKAALLKRFGG